jgi:hypothetical protein
VDGEPSTIGRRYLPSEPGPKIMRERREIWPLLSLAISVTERAAFGAPSGFLCFHHGKKKTFFPTCCFCSRPMSQRRFNLADAAFFPR